MIKLFYALLWKLKNLYSRLHKPAFNVLKRANTTNVPRALFVYLASPFHLSETHPAFHWHQSFIQAKKIAQILDKAGFVVDVADHNDASFRPCFKYDLVLSHRADHTGLEDAFSKDTVKIYLSSGLAHPIANTNQLTRLEYLMARRGRTMNDLIWDSPDLPYLKVADSLIGFGNEFVMNSWRTIFEGPCFGFNNFPTTSVCPVRRDYSLARQNFLFLGSNQHVRKGLDILLDVFPQHPNLHLWICGHFKNQREFCELYEQELFHTPNIHPCGFVDVTSKHFRRIAKTCAFIIYPTSSEGSPGSVMNAMATGMVPVATREVGIDLEPWSLTFSDYRIETIEQMLTTVSEMSSDEFAQRSKGILDLIQLKFSEEAFSNRWHEIIKNVLKHKRK